MHTSCKAAARWMKWQMCVCVTEMSRESEKRRETGGGENTWARAFGTEVTRDRVRAVCPVQAERGGIGWCHRVMRLSWPR